MPLKYHLYHQTNDTNLLSLWPIQITEMILYPYFNIRFKQNSAGFNIYFSWEDQILKCNFLMWNLDDKKGLIETKCIKKVCA
jgi:hypothetical protein